MRQNDPYIMTCICTHPDFSTSYVGYFKGTMMGATVHAEATEYPHSTFKGTPTYSSHSGAALYETFLASWEESGCAYDIGTCKMQQDGS